MTGGGIEIQPGSGFVAGRGLKRFVWVSPALGVALALFLVLFQMGLVPGFPRLGGGASVVLLGAAAFLVVAGSATGVLWKRILDTRTQRVTLDDVGIHVLFSGGKVSVLAWNDPALMFKIVEGVDPPTRSLVRLEWGSAGMGFYAFLSTSGASSAKSEARARGLESDVSTFGKPGFRTQITTLRRPDQTPLRHRRLW